MARLTCKECSTEYSGDEDSAWVCDECWHSLLERGVPEEQIIEDYSPTDEDVDNLEWARNVTDGKAEDE